MSPVNATLYRRAAHINYVALDRPDLSFASRVASSKMSDPQEGDDQMVKRSIKYLKGKPRVAIRYQFQEESDKIVVFTDSDWAGDVKTRKSTRGGVVCRGSYTISWWCKLQSNIALSSCEAELNASLKGAVEGLNVQRIAAASGDELPLILKTDASAARGVLMRQGVGKVRHLQLKRLWLQENVAAGGAKIPRVENYADALTHPWSAHDLPFWEAMGICFIPRGQTRPEGLCSYTNRRSHEGSNVLSWPCRGHASVLGFRQPAASEPARSYSYAGLLVDPYGHCGLGIRVPPPL